MLQPPLPVAHRRHPPATRTARAASHSTRLTGESKKRRRRRVEQSRAYLLYQSSPPYPPWSTSFSGDPPVPSTAYNAATPKIASFDPSDDHATVGSSSLISANRVMALPS